MTQPTDVCTHQRNQSKLDLSMMLCILLRIVAGVYDEKPGIAESPLCRHRDAFHCDDTMTHCIDANLTCNGVSECRNGHDESVIVCGCQPNEFQCNQTHCIDIIRRCDRQADCEGEEDEKDCETFICPKTHTKCGNGFCIPRDFLCDHKDDCGDNSDEQTCKYRDCFYSEWKCNNSQCILSEAYLCDGTKNCIDGSDEWNCELHYIMANGMYVSKKHRCNGDVYYKGVLTDELNCGPCISDQYRCRNTRCINQSSVCDGVCDCGYDCDDEENCNGVPCLSEGWYACDRSAANWPRCVRQDYLCDGNNDCHDRKRQDEAGCASDPKPYCYANVTSVCKLSTCPEAVCNGLRDCPDDVDEQNCALGVECGADEFLCGSGECVSLSSRCNISFECKDFSDEKHCEQFQCPPGTRNCSSGQCVAEEFWCDWTRDCLDGSDEGATCSNRKPSCAADEFRCESGQCIPESDKCFRRKLPNGRLAGCADNSHLFRCKNFTCPPGGFKCHISYCVPEKTVCDGMVDCIYSATDELECSFLCPYPVELCLCNNTEMDCTRRGLSALPDTSMEPGLNKFILRSNNIGATLSASTFKNMSILIYLDISENNIESLEREIFKSLWRLRTLNVENNYIEELRSNTFVGLANLNTLYLRGNRIIIIHPLAFTGLAALTALDLSHQRLREIEENAFHGLRNLYTLNLSYNQIEVVVDGAFSGLGKLKKLDLSNNRISIVGPNVFNGLRTLNLMYTDEFRFCCLAPGVGACFPEPDEFSSCEDLMSNFVLRVSIWVLGIIALFGNILVIFWRCKDARNSKVHSFLITNLAIGDLLMGVYLMLIACVDFHFRGVYSLYDAAWRESGLCLFAGFLSTFSSELSVFTLTVITLDRFVSIIFPFRFRRLNMCDARVVMSATWALVALLGIIPLFNIDYFEGFYGRSGVCLALHITHDKPNGWEYAVFIFLALNFVSFVAIIVAYVWMFLVAKRTRAAARSPEMKKDDAMARRMTLIVLTDFFCWMPIILLGCASLGGATIPPQGLQKSMLIVLTDFFCWMPIIPLGCASLGGATKPPQVFAWIAVFVLPLNAAVNPILYTLSTASFLGKARGKVFRFRPSLKSSVNGDNTRTLVTDDRTTGYEKIRYNSSQYTQKRYQAIEMTPTNKGNRCDSTTRLTKTESNGTISHQTAYNTVAASSPDKGSLKPDVICLYNSDVTRAPPDGDTCPNASSV